MDIQNYLDSTITIQCLATQGECDLSLHVEVDENGDTKCVYYVSSDELFIGYDNLKEAHEVYQGLIG